MCVCIFLSLFARKTGSAERERRINLVEEDMPSKMEEESSCCPFSPSSLWEVIVKCDDICFAHVLAEIEFERSQILVRSEYRRRES